MRKLREQSRALGLTEDQADEMINRAGYGDAVPDFAFDVLPPNRKAWSVFSLCGDQWLRAGMDGRPVALNLVAVKIAADAVELAVDADLIRRVRVLTGAILKVWNHGRK